jgi:hypothetical protein
MKITFYLKKRLLKYKRKTMKSKTIFFGILFFISPKGKYLGGKRLLVITFKKDDNTWYETIEMGSAINISYEGARFPGMSPDGKYLFFTRYDEKWNEGIYWVDAKIIEELKPQNYK